MKTVKRQNFTIAYKCNCVSECANFRYSEIKEMVLLNNDYRQTFCRSMYRYQSFYGVRIEVMTARYHLAAKH